MNSSSPLAKGSLYTAVIVYNERASATGGVTMLADTKGKEDFSASADVMNARRVTMISRNSAYFGNLDVSDPVLSELQLADNEGFRQHEGLELSGSVNPDAWEREQEAREKSFHRRLDEIPTFLECLWLLYRNPVIFTRDYFGALKFKMKNFCKMTIGYWDKELIHCMKVRYLADRFDEDPTDGTPRDREMISLLGMSHSLLWQFIPGCVILSKIGEAANYAPIYIDTEEVSNIPYFWPTFIRKNGCVANMRAHSAFMYNVFADHAFGHDIYAAARFLKWLGQILKVFFTILVCVFPDPTVITFFLITSSGSNTEEAMATGDSDPNGDKQARWLLYFNKRIWPPVASAIGEFCSSGEKVGRAVSQMCLCFAGHHQHHKLPNSPR